METVIYAEQLDRRGHVLQRVRVDALPFRIGRAYTNELIVDDPHVSPVHAELARDESGALVLRDLGSLNGIVGGGTRQRRPAFEVHGDDVFHLGRALLRFRGSDHAVPGAIPHTGGALLEWLDARAPLTLLGLPLVIGVTIASRYRASYDEVEWLELWRAALAVVLVLAAWAGTWGFVSRLLSQRAHLAAHWTIACLAELAAEAIGAGMEWFEFLVPSINGADLLQFGLTLCVAIAGLHAHLSAAGAFAQPRRRLLAAAAVSVAGLGFMQLSDLSHRSDFVSDLPYWSQLKPIDPSWVPSESVDDFFAGAEALRSDVDELAARPPRP